MERNQISKKNRIGFAAWVIVVAFLLAFLIMLFRYLNILTEELFVNFITAKILTTIHFFAGYALMGAGLKKADKSFIKIVFGGMVIRLFLMLGAIFMGQKLLNVRDNSFIFLVFIFYFYYLTLEIYYLSKKAIKK